MIAFWIVMAVLVGGLLFSHKTKRKRIEWVLKPLAALTFIVAAIYAGALDSTYGIVLFVGLVLAAGGDVLLLPKDQRAFLGGIISFLLGHVAYGVAFVIRGVDPTVTLLALGALIVPAVPILRWLWPHAEGAMRGAVVAYIAVITAMVALAIGTTRDHMSLAILLGAVCFYLSDLSVARDRFVSPGFVNKSWGLPLYFFAQLTLAMSVS